MALHPYENVNVLLSGQYAFSKEDFPYRDLAGWHSGLVNRFGADRCMWATDFPWILEAPGYEPYTRVIDELMPDLDEESRRLIMGETARRVLKFR